MKRFLLDTNTAAHFVHRRHGVHHRADVEVRKGNRVGICTIVMGELWDGVEYSESRDRNASLTTVRTGKLVMWPYDKAAALEYGRIAADLRRRGRLIQQPDIQIAAITLLIPNCTLVTTDSDFQVVAGLRIENWVEEK